MTEQLERLMKAQSTAQENWLKRCAQLVTCEQAIIIQFQKERCSIRQNSLGLTTTEHQLFIDDIQVGTTLIIKREYFKNKIRITVSERPL